MWCLWILIHFFASWVRFSFSLFGKCRRLAHRLSITPRNWRRIVINKNFVHKIQEMYKILATISDQNNCALFVVNIYTYRHICVGGHHECNVVNLQVAFVTILLVPYEELSLIILDWNICCSLVHFTVFIHEVYILHRLKTLTFKQRLLEFSQFSLTLHYNKRNVH